MADWWPIDKHEHPDRGCDICGEEVGRSRDDRGRIYCPRHRERHEQ